MNILKVLIILLSSIYLPLFSAENPSSNTKKGSSTFKQPDISVFFAGNQNIKSHLFETLEKRIAVQGGIFIDGNEVAKSKKLISFDTDGLTLKISAWTFSGEKDHFLMLSLCIMDEATIKWSGKKDLVTLWSTEEGIVYKNETDLLNQLTPIFEKQLAAFFHEFPKIDPHSLKIMAWK